MYYGNECEECGAACFEDYELCYDCGQEPVDVSIEGVVRESRHATVVRLPGGGLLTPRTVSLPTSQIETLAPKVVVIPRWLAHREGLV